MKLTITSVTKRQSEVPIVERLSNGTSKVTSGREPSEEFQIQLLPKLYVYRTYQRDYGAKSDDPKHLWWVCISIYFLIWRLSIEWNTSHYNKQKP